ncbi:Glucans biosynthesis glucosyltransferase H [Cedecea neteri]|uniref:Glucans biosynthesis glucosyltransferase H n=1 Tax=Cedecea neteri TaxID=158822 RepID=A0A2X3JDE9_9ENTR|nr:Glucans biosynthesis glucosyltransferase H [Cedecea neteri]
MVLLFLPKLLSIILIWCKGSKEYGGFLRVTCSLLLEVLFSVLLAPVRMLFHTVFVVSAFLGWEVVWNSPQRDDDSTPWGEAFMRHGSQLLLGLVWAVGMAWLDLRFLFWLAPIVFSLILSPFVSVLSSRATPRPAHQALEAVPDPGRVFSAAGAGGHRELSGAEPQPHAGRWLYARGV